MSLFAAGWCACCAYLAASERRYPMALFMGALALLSIGLTVI